MYSSTKIHLSSEEAVTILTKFLPATWASVDPSTVTITRIAEGYVNTLNIVQITGHDDSRVIIRHSGGNLSSELLNSMQENRSRYDELIVMQEMSRTRFGPKLYGVFNGGSVIEYIDSHTMTFDECNDRTITDDVAKSLAYYHQMDLPLTRGFPLEIPQDITADAIEAVRKSKPFKDGVSPSDYSLFINCDFPSELKWIRSAIGLCDPKVVFCQRDNNLANILIRHHPGLDQLKVVLIDYEGAKYSYRGCDLSGFFILSSVDPKDKNNLLFRDLPFDRTDMKHFIQTYTDEWNKTAPDALKDPDRDTFDQILKEVELGCAIVCLECVVGIFKSIEGIEKMESNIFPFFTHIFKLYLKSKEQFLHFYPEFD